MATSSSLCKNLNSPFVSVTLTVAQPDGKINTKSIEMTIPEFQVSKILHIRSTVYFFKVDLNRCQLCSFRTILTVVQRM